MIGNYLFTLYCSLQLFYHCQPLPTGRQAHTNLRLVVVGFSIVLLFTSYYLPFTLHITTYYLLLTFYSSYYFLLITNYYFLLSLYNCLTTVLQLFYYRFTILYYCFTIVLLFFNSNKKRGNNISLFFILDLSFRKSKMIHIERPGKKQQPFQKHLEMFYKTFRLLQLSKRSMLS